MMSYFQSSLSFGTARMSFCMADVIEAEIEEGINLNHIV